MTPAKISTTTARELLELIDAYQLLVQQRGGYVPLQAAAIADLKPEEVEALEVRHNRRPRPPSHDQ